jgi:hypothetical protein
MLLKNWSYGFKKMISLFIFKKTAAMFFQSNQSRHPNKPLMLFNDTEIAFKPKVRFLGIYITEKIKMECPCSFTMFKFE